MKIMTQNCLLKIMLKRRKESDTYLAADRRHRRSTQIAMKVDKVCSFQPALSPSSAEEEESSRTAYSGYVFCQQPGRCRSLSFFLS